MTQHCGTTAVTGHCGAVFLNEEFVARVTQWTLDISTAGVRYFSTDARAWSKFIPSVHTGTGHVNFIYQTEFGFDIQGEVAQNPQDIIVSPGDYVSISLVIFGTQGWFIPQAVIMGYSMQVDILTAEVVGGSFGFEIDGVVSYQGNPINPIVPPGFGTRVL